MNCPICHAALKRSEIESTEIFPCPYCHKFLRRATRNPVFQLPGWLGAIAGVLVLIAGVLRHSRFVRDLGGLLALLVWLIEMTKMVFRGQYPSNELEPAEPVRRHK